MLNLGNSGVIGLEGYTGPGTTWDDEMNFVMNHAPGAGSIARPVDQQSSALPLCYGRPNACRPLYIKIQFNSAH